MSAAIPKLVLATRKWRISLDSGSRKTVRALVDKKTSQFFCWILCVALCYIRYISRLQNIDSKINKWFSASEKTESVLYPKMVFMWHFPNIPLAVSTSKYSKIEPVFCKLVHVLQKYASFVRFIYTTRLVLFTHNSAIATNIWKTIFAISSSKNSISCL